MTLAQKARRALPALMIACALGVAACGEDDVERNLNDGADAAKEAGEDAKREAEEAGKDAKREAEKGANELEKELED